VAVTADSGKARDFILLRHFASRERNGPNEASDAFHQRGYSYLSSSAFMSSRAAPSWRALTFPRSLVSSCARRVLQYFVKMKSACCRNMGHSCGVEKGKEFYERPFALHRPFQQNFVSAIHCTLIVLNAH